MYVPKNGRCIVVPSVVVKTKKGESVMVLLLLRRQRKVEETGDFYFTALRCGDNFGAVIDR